MLTTDASERRLAHEVEELPLTPMQEGMLFHRLMAPGSGVDIEQIVCRDGRSIDARRLVAAFDVVIAQHPILRTAFEWQGRERPTQRAVPQGSIPLEVHDWSEVAQNAQNEQNEQNELDARFTELLHRDRLTDFDMQKPPLMRLHFVRLPNRRSAFVWSFHHILLDGRSFPLVLRDVFAAYEALGRGEIPVLQDSPPFSEFVRFVSGTPKERSLAYFRELLDGCAGPVPLDVGFVPRVGVHALPRSVSMRTPFSGISFTNAAARFDATPNTLFQAAWAIVLARYAGVDDVVFGATRACREPRIPGVAGMIGLLINTLPVRVRFPGNLTVKELVSGLRAQHLAIRPHELVSLADVQRLVKLPPGTSLFETIAVLDTATLDARMKRLGPRFEECSFEYLGQTNFPLTLAGYLEPEPVIRLEFDPVRYDHDTATRMLRHTVAVLRELLDASPDASVDSLPMLSPEERDYLVEGMNRTDGAFPREERMTDAFEAQVERRPDAIALVCAGAELTYAQLDARVNRLAHFLKARGVGPGERVALCIPRSIDLVVAMIAVLEAGGAYVPLDPAYPQDRLRFMIEDTRSRILLTVDSLRAILPQTSCELISLDVERDAIAACSPERPVRTASPDDIAYIIYTSGSTGLPKGVVVRHRPAVNLIDWVNRTFEVGPNDRLLFVTSVCFDLSVYDVFGMLAAGGSIHVTTADDLREPRTLVSLLRSGKITFWDSAPAALMQLVPFFPADDRASRLRLVFLSGDWIPVPLPDRIRHAFPAAEVVSLGGATEATVWSNYYRVGQVDHRWPSIPYGRPIRNARYYVLDSRLEPKPIGVAGELFIGGLCLADGYLGRPELNAEKFIDNPHLPGTKLYRTGDLARFMPDGNLEFLGRLDHQVKVRGYRIELGEIESVLNEQPSVVSSLVLAPHASGAERMLVAYVVGQDGRADVDELRAACRRKLPDYMVPAHFVVLDAFPVTANGKVDRRALPEPKPDATTAFVPPRNPLEMAVAQIFEECLGRERVGVHDSFFELGGHSLVAVRVISEIGHRLGREFSLAAFLAEPSVEAVAAGLRTMQVEGMPAEIRLRRRPEAEPVVALSQRRLLFLQRLDPESGAYNVTIGLRIEGSLDVSLLRRAVDAFVDRHEPLRTSFVSIDGEESARILDHVSVPFVELDLGHLSGHQQDAELDRFVRSQNDLPFDPGQAPLLRVALVHLSPTAHVLAWVVHHVVFDGTSTSVLRRELVELYDAFAEDRPDPLPPLPIRYNDFALAQLENLRDESSESHLAFVRERLGGTLPILQLPADHVRPARMTYRGSVLPFALSPEIAEALARFAAKEGTTLYVLLLAAYTALLHRYTGQDDILVGTPVSGRDEPETEGLVGLLIDTIVVRSDIDPRAPFSSFLAHVRTRFLEAFEHRALPFERVVEELNPPRDTSTTPITQTFFSFEETTGRTHRGKSFDLSAVTLGYSYSRTDLSVFVQQNRKKGISGYIEYSTDLFEPSTIAAFADSYRVLLEHIAMADGDAGELARLPVLSAEERIRQIRLGNDTEADFDFAQTVVHRFESRAIEEPDRLAVVHRGVRLTYGDLLDQVRRLDGALRASGVVPGDSVAIFLERGPRLVVATMAIMRAGACYVPLDPTHPKGRNARILRIAEPRLVVTEREVSDSLPEEDAHARLDLDVLETRHVEASSVANLADPEGLAYVIFTSGSTGDPKGVEVPQHALTNFLCSMVRNPGMSEDDRLVAVTTISFDIAGLELFLPLVTGASVEIADRSVALDPTALAAHLASGPATMLQATPATFRMLLDAGWQGQRGLRLLCGGEPMPHDFAESLVPRVAALYNVYGPTETTIWSSLDRVAAHDRLLTIGVPIHNTQMYVLNDALEPVPNGVSGMLYIGGDGLARGYRGRPDLTAAAFLPDPFSSRPGARLYRTGDLARRLADGRLECLGRSDFQVKIRGYRIELGEIEARLAEHPEVRAAIVHVDRSGTEPRLVAFVVPAADAEVSPERLLEQLHAKVPAYMVPSSMVMLEELPLTANGKVDRKALRMPSRTVTPSADGVAPRNDDELRVAHIFERVLGTAPDSVHSSFFDLGGNSLLTVRLVRELNASFGASITIGTVFETPSIKGLAEVLARGGTQSRSIVLPLVQGGNRIPVFFICGINIYLPLARALGPDQSSYGIFVPAEEQFFDGRRSGSASVEELASMYVEALRQHQSEGPYVLAGVSFGAVLAYEMARQLRADGAEVPVVVLVDAILPRAVRRGPRWYVHQLNELRREGRKGVVARAKRYVNERLAPKPGADSRASVEEIESLRRAFYDATARTYDRSVHPYTGRTVLIRARETEYVGYDLDANLGWQAHTRGEFVVYQSEGDHLGVLSVARTAEIVRRELDGLVIGSRPRS